MNLSGKDRGGSCYNERTDWYGAAGRKRSMKLAFAKNLPVMAGLLVITNASIGIGQQKGSVH